MEAIFESNGGRGIELADEIDELREQIERMEDAVSSASITTTCGEKFTPEEHQILAFLVYKRWGRDMEAAACAWRRLFQNGCTVEDFRDLITAEGTPLGDTLTRSQSLIAQMEVAAEVIRQLK